MNHVAFLRALNVGGRIIKMQELAALFTAAGLQNVKTFLASGNVVFHADPAIIEPLHAELERSFLATFGFESQVFIRSADELRAIEAFRPFPEEAATAAPTNCVGFTRIALPESTPGLLRSISSDNDWFHVLGRDIFWVSSNRQSDSSFTLKQLEKAIGTYATFRGMNTVVRLVRLCA